jgi:hypothetical protein
MPLWFWAVDYETEKLWAARWRLSEWQRELNRDEIIFALMGKLPSLPATSPILATGS